MQSAQRGTYVSDNSICYDLNMQCSSEAHIMTAWSPNGGSTLGGCETLSR
jgi:hypothetical protein